MANSEGLTIVRKTDDALGEHLATEGGDALYYCVVHEGCGQLPYASEWPEPEPKRWILQWEPLLTAVQPHAGEGLEQDDFGVTLAERPQTTRVRQPFVITSSTSSQNQKG